MIRPNGFHIKNITFKILLSNLLSWVGQLVCDLCVGIQSTDAHALGISNGLCGEMEPAASGINCGLRWLNSASPRAPGGARPVEQPLQCLDGEVVMWLQPLITSLFLTNTFSSAVTHHMTDTSAEIGAVIS